MYRHASVALAAILVLSPAGLSAQMPKEDKSVGEVVTQPLNDVNAKKKEIPPLLVKVSENPYSLEGIGKCASIAAAVNELNKVLGPDFDAQDEETRAEKREKSAKRIGGGVINSFIPFRWVIREVSGANKADDEYRAAIYAGVVRRGFLKGYGESRKCAPPAAPLPPEPEDLLPKKG